MSASIADLFFKSYLILTLEIPNGLQNHPYTSVFISLFYAGGNVNEKEFCLGKSMVKTEGMNEVDLNKNLEATKSKDRNVIYSECIAGPKKLDSKKQIRCLAWLCVIANGDGFMDKEELTFIYKIYHTELGLQLNDVIKTKKELNKIVYGKASQSIGVNVN
jgi:uncharacterized tellurite resistance protein B-like protein